ncbi:hypothetical protein V8F06_008209 [Rhypophila decipiens]
MPTSGTINCCKPNNAPLPITDPSNPNIQRWPSLGLTLVHNFISPSEEAVMISAFHAIDPRKEGKKRISQHFGYHFDYTTFGASTTHFTPVPSYITDWVLPRLPLQARKDVPDQFTVQYYPPGSGIPPHVDTHSMFGEALYSLSFGSSVPMVFKMSGPNDARKMRLPKRSLVNSSTNSAPDSSTHPETVPSEQAASTAQLSPPSQEAETQSVSQEEESWELLLPARSLLLMQGPSRYGYTHGIRSRKTDMINGQTVPREGRYSITMRTVRRGDEIGCDCAYPGVCDARIREEQQQQQQQQQELEAERQG